MARMPYLRYEDAPPEVRSVLDGYPPDVRNKHIFGILGQATAAFEPMIKYGRALVTQSQVQPQLRELATLRVARLTPGADYIWIEHLPIAAALGLSDEQVAAVAQAGSDAVAASPALSEDEKLIVRFTDQYVCDGTCDEATWNALAERFPPREIVELMLSIGHFMTFARIHATVHIDLEEDADRTVIDPAFFGARDARES